jgi:hypothetical protein
MLVLREIDSSAMLLSVGVAPIGCMERGAEEPGASPIGQFIIPFRFEPRLILSTEARHRVMFLS